MKLHNLKTFRLQKYVEYISRDKLEDLYFICFNEYPLEDLTTEDLQINISIYLSDATEEDISRIYKLVF